MITLGGGATKIHLSTAPIDLRRGYSGLYTLVEQQFGAEPQSGNLWVFTNRRRNLLKIFWWDEGGMCVLGKRLHEGTFQSWPQPGQKTVLLTRRRAATTLQRPGPGEAAAPPLGASDSARRCGSSSAILAAG
ncbi:MAG: IS66 family insertion sequence element accessory protein TnpB [Cephaloticoccus sp.]